MINKIIEFSLNNKITIFLLLVIALALGYKYTTEMPVDVYPNLNSPIVTIITENDGMPPEDIETLITFPLETAFNSLPHVKRVRSNSAFGISIINIEFEYGTEIYFARQLVSEKLQLINTNLPEGTKAPFIGPISSMFSDALEFTIKGNNLYEIRDFAEWELKPRLQTVPGVSNVINFGGLIKQYHVILNPNKMLQYNITPKQVEKALADNNINSSGGFITDGFKEKIIRGIGRIKSISDIENIVLKQSNGIPVYIANVAEVKIGAYQRRGTAGESGTEVVVVTVENQYNNNVLNTINSVETVLQEIKEAKGKNYTIEVFYTQLNMIIKSIGNLLSSMIIGAILVVIVLFLFMYNLRSTIVVALSIPITLIISIIFLYALNLSFNIMTLGGLAVGLGMIVDSSIIMGENIYRNVIQPKIKVKEAVLKGAKEVGRPIFYSILILLAVFAPIFTLHGIEGKMFIPLTYAVSVLVLVSLITSLTITPVLSSMLYRKIKSDVKEPKIILLMKNQYQKFLEITLRHKTKAIIVTALFFVAGVVLSFKLGTEFMPEMDESGLVMDIMLPPETSLEESARVASLISKEVTKIPEVKRVVRRTGRAKGAEHAEPVNITEANIVLVDKEEREVTIEEIKHEIREKVHNIPGVSILLNAPLQHRINHIATGTKSAIAIKIFGNNLKKLVEFAEDFQIHFKEIEGVEDLRLEQVSGVPQIQIKLDRNKIARYGLNVKDVSEIIEIALKGKVATEILETQKCYEILVRYEKDYRKTETEIKNMLIETPAGSLIPLSEVTKIVETENPSVIRRENAIRRIMLECNVSGRDVGSVVKDLKQIVKEEKLPEGYFVTFGGTYENQSRAIKQLSVVIILTIAVVFSLLIVSFNSFKNALYIIINIPLAFAGGVIILTLSGYTLSVPSIVGLIALIGIAVQDGIVLITHINNYRKDGLEKNEAIMKSCKNKLRPVLMTTFTTLLGLVPLAFRNVTGSEIQQPLAIVIIFGLLISTSLTLLVLPVLYSKFEK